MVGIQFWSSLYFPISDIPNIWKEWKESKRGKCVEYKVFGDFPGGPVVKNSPAKAGDVGWIPDLGTKIPHALGQLRLQAKPREKPLPATPTPTSHAKRKRKK